MKAIVVRKYVATPKELVVESVAPPACPADGFLVEVRAMGLNYFDLLQTRGKYQYQPPLVSITIYCCFRTVYVSHGSSDFAFRTCPPALDARLRVGRHRHRNRPEGS